MSRDFVDAVGDRMKAFERRETDRKAMPGLPLVVRVDGRGFSKLTKGMNRPFDQDFADLMTDVTKFLVEKTHASVGFTQSDEVSMILDPFSRKRSAVNGEVSDTRVQTEFMFDGKFQKLTSVIAGLATSRFVIGAIGLWPEKVLKTPPVFDCRVFEVPSREEAVAALEWREWDATKNAVSMAAHAHFSHSRMEGKSSREMQEMLWQEKGINFNDFPVRFRRGVYVQRKLVERELSPEILARIPLERRPTGPILRSQMVVLDLPRISSVANKVEVLLDGKDPVLISDLEAKTNQSVTI